MGFRFEDTSLLG